MNLWPDVLLENQTEMACLKLCLFAGNYVLRTSKALVFPAILLLAGCSNGWDDSGTTTSSLSNNSPSGNVQSLITVFPNPVAFCDDLIEGEQGQADFVIRNESGETLKILDIAKSCGCQSIRTDESEAKFPIFLESGAESKWTATVRTELRPGSQTIPFGFLVEDQTGRRESVDVNMEMFVTRGLKLDPSKIELFANETFAIGAVDTQPVSPKYIKTGYGSDRVKRVRKFVKSSSGISVDLDERAGEPTNASIDLAGLFAEVCNSKASMHARHEFVDFYCDLADASPTRLELVFWNLPTGFRIAPDNLPIPENPEWPIERTFLVSSPHSIGRDGLTVTADSGRVDVIETKALGEKTLAVKLRLWDVSSSSIHFHGANGIDGDVSILRGFETGNSTKVQELQK